MARRRIEGPRGLTSAGRVQGGRVTVGEGEGGRGCGTRRCPASLTPRAWRRQHPHARPLARHGVSLPAAFRRSCE